MPQAAKGSIFGSIVPSRPLSARKTGRKLTTAGELAWCAATKMQSIRICYGSTVAGMLSEQLSCHEHVICSFST